MATQSPPPTKPEEEKKSVPAPPSPPPAPVPATPVQAQNDAAALIGTEPVDGNDPNVYSFRAPAPPFSFLDMYKHRPNPKMPAPTYLKPDQLAYQQKSTLEDLLAGMEQPEDGGLKCADKEIISKQKGVLGSLLAQAAKSVFQKGGFVRISLPVRIFEPRSTLDRILDAWRLAPTYLTRAAQQKDPVQRMKDVISFVVSGMYCSMTQLKPFNPLLGETLQASFDDGTQIYCEHVSHTPPVSTFLLYGPGNAYTMSGSYKYKMDFSANSFKCKQSGPVTIRFSDGGEIVFKMPTVKMSGLVVGTRMTYLVDTMRFFDSKNGLKAVIIFDCGKSTGLFSSRKKGAKRDDFDGLLYKWKQHEPKPKKKITKITELKDIETPISKSPGRGCDTF